LAALEEKEVATALEENGALAALEENGALAALEKMAPWPRWRNWQVIFRRFFLKKTVESFLGAFRCFLGSALSEPLGIPGIDARFPVVRV
jgi:hypothetical protein